MRSTDNAARGLDDPLMPAVSRVDDQVVSNSGEHQPVPHGVLTTRFKIHCITLALWTSVAVGMILLALARHGATHEAWLDWFAFPALAIGFAVSETFVVHLRVKADAHTYSLVELPLAFGLFFANPLVVVGAQCVGAGLALVLHRRQRGLKLLFNMAAFAATTIAAILVFRSLAPSPAAIDDRTLLAGAAALLTESVLAVLLVFTVISVSDRAWRLGELRSSLAFGTTTAAFTISLALIAVIIVDARPMWTLLVIVPIVGTYLANWAYTTQRRRHEGLAFLYQSTRLLHASSELDLAIAALLEHASRTFNAAAAELVYRADPADQPMRITIGSDVDRSQTVAPFTDEALISFLDASGAVAVTHLDDGPAGDFLHARGYRDAVMAPLRIDQLALGVLVIANRLSEVVPFGPTDVVLLGTLANQTATALKNGRLEQSLEQLRVLEQRMSFQALHDPLTGLANRTLLHSELARAIDTGDASTGAVLFIDLDDFKTVNDSFGHAAGDALLVETANRLRGCSDVAATVARLGGDEFAVLLPDAFRPADARRAADRVLSAFEAPAQVGSYRLGIRASIGIAMIGPGADPGALMRSADTAMYTAKAQGKHRIVLFDPTMYESTLHQFNMRSDLMAALADRQLTVHFQPIVSLRGQHLLGCEALVRWRHPQLGMLAPASFLGIAQQSGLMPSVDLFVLDAACEFLARTDSTDPDLVPWVNINLSPETFASPTLVEYVVDTLARHCLSPDRLGIEVIEEVVSGQVSGLLHTLERLRALGVKLSLDDFGTGYSSLSHLQSLPVDVVKIAKPFIDEIASSSSQQAFTSAIVALGRALDKSVVAEGIEDRDQLELLRAIGCDAGQGYLFARPADDLTFLEWARRWTATSAEPRTPERLEAMLPTTPFDRRTVADLGASAAVVSLVS
jgi:diguanylate cyclase (GGDEF)-like protein